MGLALPALRFLARCHKEKAFGGPVLTLGRQGLHATPEQVVAMMREEGYALDRDVLARLPTQTNIPQWRATPRAGFLPDTAFFALLGLPVETLDVSAQEGPEYVADLNRPIPPELVGRFGVVIDGGTLEHVFDVRQGLMNVASMLRPGGRVVHLSPASNYLGHSFYQFSPRLFVDYYGVNGFSEMKCLLAVQPSERANIDAWRWYECAGRIDGRLIDSKRRVATVFVAEKTANATTDRVPQQKQHPWRTSSAAAGAGTSRLPLRGRVKRMLPEPVKRVLRGSLAACQATNTYGLRYVGRF